MVGNALKHFQKAQIHTQTLQKGKKLLETLQNRQKLALTLQTLSNTPKLSYTIKILPRVPEVLKNLLKKNRLSFLQMLAKYDSCDPFVKCNVPSPPPHPTPPTPHPNPRL